jgi:hypothetical protein
MSRGEVAFVHLSNAAVVATGVVLGFMAYLIEPAEEWAVVNHPWQPHVQHLHVLAAPLLVFAVGLIWRSHAVAKLRNGRRGRMTGLSLLIAFAPMAVSGYAMQVVVGEGWRSVWVAVHLTASAVWLAAFVFHVARVLIEGRADALLSQSDSDIDLAA